MVVRYVAKPYKTNRKLMLLGSHSKRANGRMTERPNGRTCFDPPPPLSAAAAPDFWEGQRPAWPAREVRDMGFVIPQNLKKALARAGFARRGIRNRKCL